MIECQALTMTAETYEIIPLRDNPEPFTWCSPEAAEYYSVYARGPESQARALVDTPSLNEALVYASISEVEAVALWTGASFVLLDSCPANPHD